jgi:hypothetical protein
VLVRARVGLVMGERKSQNKANGDRQLRFLYLRWPTWPVLGFMNQLLPIALSLASLGIAAFLNRWLLSG